MQLQKRVGLTAIVAAVDPMHGASKHCTGIESPMRMSARATRGALIGMIGRLRRTSPIVLSMPQRLAMQAEAHY